MKALFIKVGYKVKHESENKVMEVIGFAPHCKENVITQWRDETGEIRTKQFAQTELEVIRGTILN